MRSKVLTIVLTAAVGFLLATHPVVVEAAKQVTGAQVKDNSITGKDVKEKSLKGVDAKRLRGKAAEAYTNPSYRYRLPVQPAAQFRGYGFPGLSAGTYLVTLNATFTVAANGKAVLCRVDVGGSRELLGYGTPAQFNSFASTSFAGLLQVKAGAAPTLFCTSQSTPPDNWHVFDQADTPSTVTFTRVDATTAGSPTAARTVQRSASARR